MSVVNITDNYRKKPNPKRSEVRTVPNVLEKLDDLGIKYEKVEHEAVYTCEQTEFVKGLVKGQGCKNLFLKNKKKEYFLYTLPDDQRADLKTLGKDNDLGHPFADLHIL